MEQHSSTQPMRRRSPRKEPLGGQERAVVIATSVLITFAFWSYSGRTTWALIAFCWVACCVPLAAMIPPWGKPVTFIKDLAKSSVFWAGVLSLTYPLIQALNPAFIADYEPGTIPEIEPIPHIGWLPTSVQASLEIGTPWRHILMFGGIFAVFATLRVTLTRRKSWIALLWVTVINCTLVAFVGTLVKLSGTKKMLWVMDPIAPNLFFGTFTYKNNASGVMYMTIALAGSLYFYHARQALMRGLRSGPHMLCLLLIAFVALPVYITNSKSGMIITAAMCLIIAILWLIAKMNELRQNGQFRTFGLILLSSLVVFGLVVGTVGRQIVDLDQVEELLTGLTDDLEAISEDQVEESSSSNKHRYIALIAFSEMLKEAPPLGVGAGCFEYFSRNYSIRYPDIHYSRYSRDEKAWLTWHWRDAHSDWLEFPIEYGWLGFGLLLGSLIIWLPGSFHFLKHPRIYLVLPWIGASALLGHAIFEFQFQTPTVVLVFMVAWTSPWFLQNLKRV